MPVKNLMLIKARLPMAVTVNQRLEGLCWPFSNTFNGLNHWFLPSQTIKIKMLDCSHFQIFDNKMHTQLHSLVHEILQEDNYAADRRLYRLGDAERNLFVAVEYGCTYLIQQFLADSCKTDLQDIRNDAGESFFQLIEELGHSELSYNLQSLPSSSAQQNERNSFDEETGYKMQAHDATEEHVHLGMKETANYVININAAVDSLRKYLEYDVGKQILVSMMELITPFLLQQVVIVIKRLLVLRILSIHSTTLITGYVLDDIFYTMFVAFACISMYVLPNYFSVFVSKDKSDEVGKAFNTVVSMGILLVLPVYLYGSIAKQISDGIGIESTISEAWSFVAFTHMPAGIPDIANAAIESLHTITYNYYVPAIGASIEGVVVLLLALIFQQSDSLEGLALGAAFSAGSFAKLCYYLHTLHQSRMLYKYFLFQSSPSWLLMKKYFHEFRLQLCSYVFNVSNFLLTAVLVTVGVNSLGIGVFIIGKSIFDIIRMVSLILSRASNILIRRFYFSDMNELVLTTSMIGFLVVSFLSLPVSILFGSLSGEALSEFLISLNVIDSVHRDAFCDSVQQSVQYFVPYAITSSLTDLLLSWFQATLNNRIVTIIHFWIYFVLCNTAIVIMYYLDQSSLQVNLVAIMFGANVMTLLFTSLAWLNIAGFACRVSALKEKIEETNELSAKNSDSIQRIETTSFFSSSSTSEKEINQMKLQNLH
jgi:hypothetical protein